MARTIRQLADDDLARPAQGQDALAADPIDGGDDPTWAAAWAAELDERVAEADRTGDRGRPWDQVHAELLERLASR